MVALSRALVVAIVTHVRTPQELRLHSNSAHSHVGRHSHFIFLWPGLLGGDANRALGLADLTFNLIAAFGLPASGAALTSDVAALSRIRLDSPLVALGQRHSS